MAWSCGNESGYGTNDQAEFDYMKAHDPTRLALISQQGLDNNPKTDFEDYHYPPVAQMKTMLASPNRAKVPAIFTEIGGIEDPWGKILADNWDAHLGLRRHRRRLHLGMAGPEPGRQVPRALVHSQPRRPGHRLRTASASPAAAAPSPPIARSNPIATGTSRWSIAR